MTDLDAVLSADELAALRAAYAIVSNKLGAYLTPISPALAPRHYPHIRVAELMYSGNPHSDIEKSLLASSVDFVVAGDGLQMAWIKQISPPTPVVLYTNLSNLYGPLLSDWLAYAGGLHIDPETAFLHDSTGLRVIYKGISNRPLTNPSAPAFIAWALDYHRRFLAASPKADGLFVDNSPGSPNVYTQGVVAVENVTDYAKSYAALLAAVQGGLGTIIVPNTGGGQLVNVLPIVRAVGRYFAEFLLRPLAHNWHTFEDVASFLAGIQTVPGVAGILDSHPYGGATTDPRTQLAALAYFYMVAQPGDYLDFFGGFGPATSWNEHWCPAVQFDVGNPLSSWSVAQSGPDPADASAGYRVYVRTYAHATVYFRPLSFRDWQTQAKLDASSAVTLSLPSPLRPLQADGTLGQPVAAITLRNGEGAILT